MISLLKMAWCNLAHRRYWWDRIPRIPGFYLVCDRCGREWKPIDFRS